MEDAVASCSEAFKTWSKTSIITRQQIMFKFQNIIKNNMVGDDFFIHLNNKLLFVAILICFM